MHYSKYLKCKHVTTVPVETTIPPEIMKQVVKPAIVAEPVKQEFPEADPNTIDLGVINSTPENIAVPVEKAPQIIHANVAEETNVSKAILSSLTGMMQHLPTDTIVALTKQAEIMTKALEDKIDEPDTILGDEEVTEILTYLKMLEETYFEDIPLTDTPSQSYVWNIPYALYEDMCDCINNNVPDVFNPMFVFYLTMTDYPAKAMGRYLKILTDTVYDNQNEMLRLNQEYLNELNELDEEDDDDEDIHFDETDDE